MSSAASAIASDMVGDDVRMQDTMRDITYDTALVRKKWGVPPALFLMIVPA